MQPNDRSDKWYQLALHLTNGIGPVLFKQLITQFGSAAAVYQANYKKLTQVPGVGEKVARQILSKADLAIAESELSKADKLGFEIITATEERFPKRLKGLFDTPSVIYSQGNIDYNTHKTIGIIGTRQATEYGMHVTESIVKELAPLQPIIVSGLAYGIDIVAHKAAIKYQTPTVAVMANGIDSIYPAVHKRTAAELQKNGSLLTEYPLGTRPDQKRFPARNRIIAALSDVLIVVESAKRGGSLVTAEFAMNYHRDVFAVPGPLGSPQSEGCNNLISQHKASIFTTIEELLNNMRWEVNGEQGDSVSKPSFEGFSQDETQILALLHQHKSLHIDEIGHLTHLAFSRLSSLLLSLEFQGMVKSLPGKVYQLD